MQTSDFTYQLPEELIAQHPSPERDHSRLMLYDPNSQRLEHHRFYEILNLLSPGDLLVLNNSKVIPARLFGSKPSMERAIEVLILHRIEADRYACLLRPAKRVKIGDRIDFGVGDDFYAVCTGQLSDGQREIEFHYRGIFQERLEELGTMPLPPYIKERLADPDRYQTVYAKEDGSAAAPTAGLHFTERLLEKLRARGIETAFVTLHVGLGTFRPVKVEDVESHEMHSEYYVLPEETVAAIEACRARGNRVIAVGTTSCRVLESVATDFGHLKAHSASTSIFIYPGYEFKVLDGLITNFHLPESTLLMLVSAFIGRENALALYRRAVELRYRFFSFGDAMLLWKGSDRSKQVSDIAFDEVFFDDGEQAHGGGGCR
ncbi:MAG: tRNA preQ1(34) S-adenosylmethionine ribosyltransferase-isomerase QueA [Eubacteriales bacterium]|nr:tRNA preQ1(34) S-adenosylmethionine ribosyltransferase-isomerase QueA [Eubacteriales bacterium]